MLVDVTAAPAMSSAGRHQDEATRIGKIVLEAGELAAERANARKEHRGGGFSAGGAERTQTGAKIGATTTTSPGKSWSFVTMNMDGGCRAEIREGLVQTAAQRREQGGGSGATRYSGEEG